MGEYTFLIGIAAGLLLGVMSPGPSFLVVAKTAMERSRGDAIVVAQGMGLGASLFALLASFGLYAVLETVPELYGLLKLLGAVYLCFLAYRFWRSADQPLAMAEPIAACGGLWRLLMLGLFTQLSNPKTAVVLGGIFAAFLPREIPPYSALILFALAYVIDAGWYSLVAMALSTRRARALYARFKKILVRLASGFMGLISLKLVLD